MKTCGRYACQLINRCVSSAACPLVSPLAPSSASRPRWDFSWSAAGGTFHPVTATVGWSEPPERTTFHPPAFDAPYFWLGRDAEAVS